MRLPSPRAALAALRRLPVPRTLTARYPVAWGLLAGVAAGEILIELLPAHRAAALEYWASTNITNLHHHPVPALIVSAFLPAGALLAWLALVPVAMFAATRPFGNGGLLLVCVAGHVIGTLVSEGIQGYRVDHHRLPAAARTIIDIGPSYAVVAAIVIAIGFGSWLARVAAVIDLAALVFIGRIFAGLGQLQVAPVGHLTSVTVAALACALLAVRRRHRHSVPVRVLAQAGTASGSATSSGDDGGEPPECSGPSDGTDPPRRAEPNPAG